MSRRTAAITVALVLLLSAAGFCGRASTVAPPDWMICNPGGYCRGCRAAAQPEIQSGCASTQPEIVKIESDLRLLEMRID